MNFRLSPVCAAVLALILVVGPPGCRSEDPTTPSVRLPHVRVAHVVEVQARPRSRHLVLLQPGRRARLASRVGGQVVSIDVVDQQEVKAGETLVRFAKADARGGMLAAQASQTRIQAQIMDNLSELGRARSLAAQGAETARTVERLATERDTLSARLREAQAQMIRARDKSDATQIVAPFAGTVTRIDTELGEYAVPGVQILVVSQLDPLALEFTLTEDEAALHDAGGLRFAATVRDQNISTVLEWVSPEADQGTSSFPIRLVVPNPERSLRAGEAVDVEVIATAQKTQRALPATAIRYAGLESYALKLDGDKVAKVPVKVLDDAASLVTISGDLKTGDRVVRTGPVNLTDGDQVVVVEEPPDALAKR